MRTIEMDKTQISQRLGWGWGMGQQGGDGQEIPETPHLERGWQEARVAGDGQRGRVRDIPGLEEHKRTQNTAVHHLSSLPRK